MRDAGVVAERMNPSLHAPLSPGRGRRRRGPLAWACPNLAYQRRIVSERELQEGLADWCPADSDLLRNSIKIEPRIGEVARVDNIIFQM
jgi:hypothetical protein